MRPLRFNRENTAIHDRAADVLEIHVYPLRAETVESRADVLGFVVDGRIETQVFDNPAALFRTAGDAHDPAALEIADLADDRPDRACRCGDDQRFPLTRLADIEKSEIGGDASRTQRRQWAVSGTPSRGSI